MTNLKQNPFLISPPQGSGLEREWHTGAWPARWGAHPIYHSHASILGIRPNGLGFREVIIQPMLGALTAVKATLPHPLGEIAVDLTQPEPGVLRGTLALPPGVTGKLILGDAVYPLRAGPQDIPQV